jgi:hypothetical protein
MKGDSNIEFVEDKSMASAQQLAMVRVSGAHNRDNQPSCPGHYAILAQHANDGFDSDIQFVEEVNATSAGAALPSKGQKRPRAAQVQNGTCEWKSDGAD